MEVDLLDGTKRTRVWRGISHYEAGDGYSLNPIPYTNPNERVNWIVGVDVPLVVVMWR